MTIIKKVPDEQTYIDFAIDCWCNALSISVSPLEQVAVLCGNTDYDSYGLKTYIDIVKGRYEFDEDEDYAYDILEMLEKVSGKKWQHTTIRGYSQREWQDMFYVDGELDDELIERIEDFYFGKVAMFNINDGYEYCDFLPDRIVWKGKQAICDYLGIFPEEAKVLIDKGYVKQYKYEELE